jgi:hypothetical protein
LCLCYSLFWQIGYDEGDIGLVFGMAAGAAYAHIR